MAHVSAEPNRHGSVVFTVRQIMIDDQSMIQKSIGDFFHSGVCVQHFKGSPPSSGKMFKNIRNAKLKPALY